MTGIAASRMRGGPSPAALPHDTLTHVELTWVEKKIENWIVWAVVNVVSIWFYFQGELYLVALQYVFFLFNTAFGFARWRNSHD